jgi:hypothetical protein
MKLSIHSIHIPRPGVIHQHISADVVGKADFARTRIAFSQHLDADYFTHCEQHIAEATEVDF